MTGPPTTQSYVYDAIVVGVHDGDTVTLDVDFGFGIWQNKVKFRLFGPDPCGLDAINAPELPTPEGKAAQLFLSGLLYPGQKVTIQTIKDRREKYGRYLAVVWIGSVNVNQALVTAGHAKLVRY